MSKGSIHIYLLWPSSLNWIHMVTPYGPSCCQPYMTTHQKSICFITIFYKLNWAGDKDTRKDERNVFAQAPKMLQWDAKVYKVNTIISIVHNRLYHFLKFIGMLFFQLNNLKQKKKKNWVKSYLGLCYLIMSLKKCITTWLCLPYQTTQENEVVSFFFLSVHRTI